LDVPVARVALVRAGRRLLRGLEQLLAKVVLREVVDGQQAGLVEKHRARAVHDGLLREERPHAVRDRVPEQDRTRAVDLDVEPAGRLPGERCGSDGEAHDRPVPGPRAVNREPFGLGLRMTVRWFPQTKRSSTRSRPATWTSRCAPSCAPTAAVSTG